MKVHSVLERLRYPAIGLLIVGVLNGAGGFIFLLGGVSRLLGLTGANSLPTNEAEKMGFLGATILIYGIALLSLVLSPIIIYGASKMMSANQFGLAKTSAILAMLPVTGCCFLIGIPIGAWSLYVITRPEIRAAFHGGRNALNISQQPPRF